MEEIINKIYNYSLEDIMSRRFGDYSKYIIQDRAIPDARDGLKPIHRRILYAMKQDHNTYDKKFKKCAKAVGNVLGNYHPHGDTSVYDALIRLSQSWKQNEILVEVYGNNGSIDGDPAAAMRYTECRLAKVSEELLGDIEKFEKMKINFTPNFSDELLEPTVLPARFPNLLVNGATGISAGYATNMPPHNLIEIIDATIERIDHPDCTLDSILKIVKGPDFPTGGIIEGLDGLRKAYETGRGKITVMCKYEFTREKNKDKIIISEIPYEVNKALLVKKIDEVRIDKKVDGILEVRDESDKETNLRIVIDLKQGANKNLIMNYLLKNTELSVSYNFNNVTIMNRRPRLLGILPLLDAYIDHRRFCVKESSKYDLELLKSQKHILEGLIKAISILDEVIKTIRASKNKLDAQENLEREYNFTEEQAKAIVMLQLYRLTNTDVVEIENKLKEIEAQIAKLESILSDPKKLDTEIKSDLKRIKKEYGHERKTKISDTVTEIKISAEELISSEEVVIALTRDGYLKRVSLKSYQKSEEQTGLKPGDALLNLHRASTLDKLIILTDLGNYIFLPVYEINEAKWKEMGKHISNLCSINPSEKVISSFVITENNKNANLLTFTKFGMVKKTKLENYIVTRYNKPLSAIKLKSDDTVVSAFLENEKIVEVTKNGYYTLYNSEEVPVSSVKTAGVKGINLKAQDYVVKGLVISDEEYLNIFTDRLLAKRVRINDLKMITRAKRGSLILKPLKTQVSTVMNAFITSSKDEFYLKVGDEAVIIKNTDIPIMDLQSNGSSITKNKYTDIILNVNIPEESESPSEPIKAEENKIEQLGADAFLDEFKL